MKYKLLVAEDEPIDRRVLCKTLRKYLEELVIVLEARDGEEAMELIRREDPQVVLLDIEMPGRSGLEVAQWMRSSHNSSPILFLTGFDKFAYAKEAIRVRAMDYILKPYQDQELIFAVEEALQSLDRGPEALRPAEHPQVLPEDPGEAERIHLIREEIRAFIESNYMKELSMQDVARQLRYADTYFCKLFKQCFHTNFSAYLNEYRIARARELVRGSRRSIKEISAACGYSDPNYFGRVFKQLTGMTPTEYRLQEMGRKD